ncbi:MAG: hypothetical protein GQ570_03355 [Helicobacteraceae bacterium]|nr:hypothetical protein [Helicobacteraceae bacterium]
MKNLKFITVAGLKGGVGKSSISRVLAEYLSSIILNFDPKRDAKYYNAIETFNVEENAKIKKQSDCLIVDNIKITTDSEYIISDFGGQFDERIMTIDSDYYILPSADDFESITETIRTARMILDSKNDAKIIFVLNKYLIRNKKDEVQAINDFNQMLKKNNLSNFDVIEMPYSKLFKNIVNEKMTEEEVIGKSKLLKNSYRNINNFIEKLANEVSK